MLRLFGKDSEMKGGVRSKRALQDMYTAEVSGMRRNNSGCRMKKGASSSKVPGQWKGETNGHKTVEAKLEETSVL